MARSARPARRSQTAARRTSRSRSHRLDPGHGQEPERHAASRARASPSPARLFSATGTTGAGRHLTFPNVPVGSAATRSPRPTAPAAAPPRDPVSATSPATPAASRSRPARSRSPSKPERASALRGCTVTLPARAATRPRSTTGTSGASAGIATLRRRARRQRLHGDRDDGRRRPRPAGRRQRHRGEHDREDAQRSRSGRRRSRPRTPPPGACECGGINLTVSGPNAYSQVQQTSTGGSNGLATFSNVPAGAATYTASGNGTARRSPSPRAGRRPSTSRRTGAASRERTAGNGALTPPCLSARSARERLHPGRDARDDVHHRDRLRGLRLVISTTVTHSALITNESVRPEPGPDGARPADRGPARGDHRDAQAPPRRS